MQAPAQDADERLVEDEGDCCATDAGGEHKGIGDTGSERIKFSRGIGSKKRKKNSNDAPYCCNHEKGAADKRNLAPRLAWQLRYQ